MFDQTAKTKGKTVKHLPIPGAKKKAAKSNAAHGRGHVAPQAGVKAPPAAAQDSVDLDETDATGGDTDESLVKPGEVEAPEADNIENMASIADAIKSMKSKRKGPSKYDAGTNTYR